MSGAAGKPYVSSTVSSAFSIKTEKLIAMSNYCYMMLITCIIAHITTQCLF